jgi:2,4-dienoyl-CoA reductase-like NADH-dependent reductase (Old Yellow Enzyme family)
MSAESFKLIRIPSLKTVEDFRRHVASLNIELPCEDRIESGPDSPLAQSWSETTINGKTITNRWAIQPMEGWDATTTGAPTEEVRRRWQRFGESGASVIYGGEAMAVRPDGRANPNQLIINEENKGGIAELRDGLIRARQDRFGGRAADAVIIGFQLTHSGRFCRPHDKKRLEPRIAYRHPILDRKFGIDSDEVLLSDADVERLIEAYVSAAKLAADAGADFVDIKHCHGYLLHEFLGAHTRPGKFGGSFENRTRILRDVIDGIRASGNKIDIGVRLSAFDFVPFRPDPARSQPGKLGPGIPEEFSHCLPYQYGFGVNPQNPIDYDLTEPLKFMELCGQLGVKLLNLSAGSPYYNPHIQRPAAYPPSDGYQPAHDPLIDVARQINVVREFKKRAPRGMAIIGSAYSYLQEYLPQVAQYVLRTSWTDMVGLGRTTLSYPGMLADAVTSGTLATKSICRTFSDCTTAPRNGLISGCYPLDKYYSARPEFQKLKEIKKATGV